MFVVFMSTQMCAFGELQVAAIVQGARLLIVSLLCVFYLSPSMFILLWLLDGFRNAASEQDALEDLARYVMAIACLAAGAQRHR